MFPLCLMALIAFRQVGLTEEKSAEQKPAMTLEQAGPSYNLQGEYLGEIMTPEGKQTWGAQIISLDDNEYQGWAYPGGLPGKGADLEKREGKTSQSKDGEIFFEGDFTKSIFKDNEIEVNTLNGDKLGTMNKVIRLSPTLGKKPPKGAVVLFDGTSADGFVGGKMTEDGLLKQGATSKETFQDCHVHLEFMLSYMPWARGQDRSNSGCYLQGRYEVQILDSFGLEGLSNECGGIYSIRKPDVNMCFAPLTWQTYDIDFTAAKFDPDGKKNSQCQVNCPT